MRGAGSATSRHYVVPQKQLQYDSFSRLADAVASVLAEAAQPLRPKDIGSELPKQGWGDPPSGAVNNVLTQHLAERVVRVQGDRWQLRPAT